jgi:hypothetical protein|tara:strand:+ start:4883 stop:5470 length:588 start_codon:yes stop_codon:yes gene_type:complete
MAQFNDWEPKLGPVTGKLQEEPRVFGHDAKVVVPGALNLRLPDSRVLKVTTAGSGYDSSDVGDTLTQSSTGGSGTGMEVNITEINGTTLGAVTVITAGSGYVPGDTITFSAASSGGSGGKATVQADGITLPDVTTRGAVIYNGKNAAQDITIITEGGSQIEFKQVQSGDVVGSKTPMLAMAVRNDDTPTDLVAIY